MKNMPWLLPVPLLFLPFALPSGAETGVPAMLLLTGIASAFILIQYARKCSPGERTSNAYWNHVKSGWHSLMAQMKSNSGYRELFIAFTIAQSLLLCLVPLVGIPNLIIAAHYLLVVPALKACWKNSAS